MDVSITSLGWYQGKSTLWCAPLVVCTSELLNNMFYSVCIVFIRDRCVIVFVKPALMGACYVWGPVHMEAICLFGCLAIGVTKQTNNILTDFTRRNTAITRSIGTVCLAFFFDWGSQEG